jgi:hypothetical protein
MSSMKKEMSVMKPSAQKGRRGRIVVMAKKVFVKVEKLPVRKGMSHG